MDWKDYGRVRAVSEGTAISLARMLNNKALTAVDKEVYALCPKDHWFEADELPPYIRCREYRLGRLRDAGFLRSQVIDPLGKFVVKYWTNTSVPPSET